MRLVILNAFNRLTQDALAIYTHNVVNLTTADPQFSSLSAEVTELKKRYDAYVVALSNIVNGGRIATLEKDRCKKEVKEQMTNVALLVDFLAKGDESIILAAGFDVRKPATSYTALEAPSVIKIVNETATGVVTIQLEKVPGATNYGIEKRTKTDGQTVTPWTNGEYTSTCRTQLKGLESGKIYQFQFRAIGNKGLVSEWSQVVELLVS